MRQPGAVAQHRHRAGKRGSLRSEPGEPQPHPAPGGPRAQLGQLGRSGVVRRDALGGGHRGQLTQQQRVAAGRGVTGHAERVLDVAHHRPHQRRRGGLAEGGRTQHGDHRVGGQQIQQMLLGAGLGGPQRSKDQHRQPIQPGQQVRQPPQRLGVGPVQVIHAQQQRALRGQVRRQPEQAVQRREPAGRGPISLGRPEQRRRRPGGAVQQLSPIGFGGVGQHRLEQLARHTEGELALQLRAACCRDPHPGAMRLRAGLGQQAALADPGRAFHHREAARAGSGGGDE